jgi:hypothetical protein
MDEAGRKIRIDALPLGQASAQLQETLDGGMHGDLGTWQVVIQGSSEVLPLLAMWLLKRRKKTVVDLHTMRFDGQQWESHLVHVQTSEESAPEVGVLQQLTNLMTAAANAGPGQPTASA